MFAEFPPLVVTLLFDRVNDRYLRTLIDLALRAPAATKMRGARYGAHGFQFGNGFSGELGV